MTERKITTEAGWNFENSYTRLPGTFYSMQDPDPVRSPELAVFNGPLAEALGLNAESLQSKDGAEVFGGNRIPDGASPLAQAYAGHQFGYFNMLGDGRAVLLGEQITPEGERVDVQLKGAGRTPYSRGGDGRASLGPMLREYIMSEAMHALGIPTTRSLGVVTTGESVVRETMLPGAVLTRTAASHLRVGTFQYAVQFGSKEDLRNLADYAIERHFPDIEEGEGKYLALLRGVIKRQASLIAKWQLAGFIHGVMNTDNMTISGETIDYGPCAFMDNYDPATVFSSIDREGRYAYGNQPPIGGWNLTRFAETLVPLFHDDQEQAVELAQDELSAYPELYRTSWLAGMRAKLGLFSEEPDDEALIEDLLSLMKKHEADYTNTFVSLTFKRQVDGALSGNLEYTKWHERWHERLERQDESKEAAREHMKKSNPAVIPRNHRVEEALDAAVKEGDYSVMERLLDVLANPYAHTDNQAEYARLPEPSNRVFRTYCGT
ncbi:protein adenylyltransferase SelO [Bacillus marinisedimentorum]|uniref:protein adenylyltransferase SelO n=1 Tax=Bacillus marinisedimentorum TaxID=1821260 RepID=UPI0007DF4001|nr:YdiU family protein [Bacillus marinisedimentorum]